MSMTNAIAARGEAARAKRSAHTKSLFAMGAIHIALVAVSLTMVLPFLWMVLTQLNIKNIRT